MTSSAGKPRVGINNCWKGHCDYQRKTRREEERGQSSRPPSQVGKWDSGGVPAPPGYHCFQLSVFLPTWSLDSCFVLVYCLSCSLHTRFLRGRRKKEEQAKFPRCAENLAVSPAVMSPGPETVKSGLNANPGEP